MAPMSGGREGNMSHRYGQQSQVTNSKPIKIVLDKPKILMFCLVYTLYSEYNALRNLTDSGKIHDNTGTTVLLLTRDRMATSLSCSTSGSAHTLVVVQYNCITWYCLPVALNLRSSSYQNLYPSAIPSGAWGVLTTCQTFKATKSSG
jgi:hypothetical protein